jgi:hypothetical protein
MNDFFKTAIIGLLGSAFLVAGCTTTIEEKAGFPVYKEIQPSRGYSYFLDSEAPHQISGLLLIAVNHWNQALGAQILKVTKSQKRADVSIHYKTTDGVQENPAHTELLGCMKGYGLAHCRINLEAPKSLDSGESMKPLAHLFTQGPLDQQMYKLKDYSDAADYLHDKLILMSLVHEIGHTLGLAHTKEEGCIMAAAPSGHLGFCDAELKAARSQLASVLVSALAD